MRGFDLTGWVIGVVLGTVVVLAVTAQMDLTPVVAFLSGVVAAAVGGSLGVFITRRLHP